jgi:hypothetical protein
MLIRCVEYEIFYHFATTQMRCPLRFREEKIRTLNYNRTSGFLSEKLNESFNGLRSSLELLVLDSPEIYGVV